MSENLNKVLQFLNNYKVETGCRGIVLGISGGKDSTVVAMLAKKVWGKNVFGVLMPNGEQADIEDSYKVVEALDLDYLRVNIGEAYKALLGEFVLGDDIDLLTAKAKTNIPPRLRMTALYAIAQSKGYRVAGTGNASERYIGWFTKWGDGACDFNPLANLTCSEVVDLGLELAEEFGIDPELIKKVPADGLTMRSDEDNFGFTYKDLDTIIRHGTAAVRIGWVSQEVFDKIEKLHAAAHHKLELPVTALAEN